MFRYGVLMLSGFWQSRQVPVSPVYVRIGSAVVVRSGEECRVQVWCFLAVGVCYAAARSGEARQSGFGGARWLEVVSGMVCLSRRGVFCSGAIWSSKVSWGMAGSESQKKTRRI